MEVSGAVRVKKEDRLETVGLFCKVKPQARPVVLESLSDEADIKTSFCYNRNAAANCIQKSKRRDIQKCL